MSQDPFSTRHEGAIYFLCIPCGAYILHESCQRLPVPHAPDWIAVVCASCSRVIHLEPNGPAAIVVEHAA